MIAAVALSRGVELFVLFDCPSPMPLEDTVPSAVPSVEDWNAVVRAAMLKHNNEPAVAVASRPFGIRPLTVSQKGCLFSG